MAQTVRSRIKSAERRLREAGQGHLTRFIRELSQPEQVALLEEIEGLDLELIAKLIEECVLQEPKISSREGIRPAQAYSVESGKGQGANIQRAMARGEQLIAEHKVAAFTVAGGVGTRLDFEGPKGDVKATPLRNKSLFQVFAEGIQAVQRKFNCVVPWYVMTSQSNHEATLKSFEQYDYFGLERKNVMHFPQGMMPCFDQAGQILLSGPGHIAMSPDGHGGSLRALYSSGALGDMAKRGIEYISYFQVDNPLVNILDPLFLGLHVNDGAEMSSKAVVKCEPFERVGNFAEVAERICVIEYSDLPEELALARREDGRLQYELGSIAVHLLNRKFVERLNVHGFSLPWHRATKIVGYVDETGELVEPDEPNGIKLETFVFDALPLAKKSIILSVKREEEFAPIKNATGVDSLESSQQYQINRAARWMEQAGIEVPRKPDGLPDLIVEISPLFAMDEKMLSQKRNQLRPLQPGDMVYLG